MAEFIKLNVGGVEYSATKSTLCAYPESMLAKMFGGELANKKDWEGRVIIDRDGALFGYILNFLRSAKLALPKDFKQIDQLGLEADFFQIQPLMEEIDRITSYKPERVFYQEFFFTENGYEIVSAFVSGLSHIIDNLDFAKGEYLFSIPGTKSRIIEESNRIIRMDASDTIKARSDMSHQREKRTRFCITERMISNGWEIESTEETVISRLPNLPLKSIIFKKIAQ